jgi:histone H3/H4
MSTATAAAAEQSLSAAGAGAPAEPAPSSVPTAADVAPTEELWDQLEDEVDKLDDRADRFDNAASRLHGCKVQVGAKRDWIGRYSAIFDWIGGYLDILDFLFKASADIDPDAVALEGLDIDAGEEKVSASDVVPALAATGVSVSELRSRYERIRDHVRDPEFLPTKLRSSPDNTESEEEAIIQSYEAMLDECKALAEQVVIRYPSLGGEYRDRLNVLKVCHEQLKTETIISRRPFARLVAEIGQDFKMYLRFTPNAMLAFQTASEAYLTELFARSNLIAIHSGKDYVDETDFQLARHLLEDVFTH